MLIPGSALALIVSGIVLGAAAGTATSVTNQSAAYAQPRVELAQPGPVSQVGAPFSLTATVTEFGAPRAAVGVAFTVTGANPQANSSATNEAGHAAFTYVGSTAGTDHIVASFQDATGKTVVSNEVTQTWTAPPPGKEPPGAHSARLPAPVLGKTVNVELVSGFVFVKLPSGAQVSRTFRSASESLSKGTGFVPLTTARQIPVGSTLDTTAGVVQLATATATSGRTQFGDFGAGIFTILQQRSQRGLAKLNIINTQRPRRVCASIGKKAQTAKKHLGSRVLGRLKGSAHGKFTTRGQYSAATVRGTVWNVSNRCAGTLTQVGRGVVSVRDFLRRKTITLHAGQRYLAKAP